MTESFGVQTIFLVDDDASVRKALSRVLREEGWNVETFESAEAFLARPGQKTRGCVVLDVTMPGLVSGHGDIPMSVQAIKAGATDFLTKPVEARVLVAAVRAAIDQDNAVRRSLAAMEELRQRLASLTPREREILVALARGKLNKQIAGDLGVVEQTVKFHRARIMERMRAKTVAELMHIAARVGISAEMPTAGSAPSSDHRSQKLRRT